MKRQFIREGSPVMTVAALGTDQWFVSEEGTDQVIEASVRQAPDGTLLLTVKGITTSVVATVVGDEVWLSSAKGAAIWRRHEERRGASAGAADSVSSPMTGKVVVVNVEPGDTVSAGDVLVVIEAMKMEQPLCAPRDGIVATVRCAVDDLVDGGVALVTLAVEEAE
ncbi:MAG TPA: hypothetical protein DCQ06_01315 [Myxococcales bacterium]|nr:hypothetical protein [Myxococcales bacterium]